jgi:hypothetical protein
MYPVKLSAEVLLTTIITALTSLITQLEKIDFKEAYKINGYRTGDYEITKAPSANDYETARSFCKATDKQLFTVQSSFDIEKIFAHFEVEQVWTDVTRGGEKTEYSDSRGNSPILQAKDVTIKQVVTDTNTADREWDTKALSLAKVTETKFQYKEDLRTTKLPVLCLKMLNFPFKSIDIERFGGMRDRIVTILKDQKEFAQEEKQAIYSYHAFFPLYDKPVGTENVIDLQTDLDILVTNCMKLLGNIASDCSKIERAMDLEIFNLSFFERVHKLIRLIHKIMLFFKNPKAIFPKALHAGLPDVIDHNVPLARLNVNDSMYLILVGKNETQVLNKNWYRFVSFGHSFFRAQIIDLVLLALGIAGILIGFISLITQFYGRPLKVRFKGLKNFRKRDSVSRVAQMEMITEPAMPTRQPIISETVLQPCTQCSMRRTGTVPRSNVRYPQYPQGPSGKIVYRRTKMSSVPLYLADSDLSD